MSREQSHPIAHQSQHAQEQVVFYINFTARNLKMWTRYHFQWQSCLSNGYEEMVGFVLCHVQVLLLTQSHASSQLPRNQINKGKRSIACKEKAALKLTEHCALTNTLQRVPDLFYFTLTQNWTSLNKNVTKAFSRHKTQTFTHEVLLSVHMYIPIQVHVYCLCCHGGQTERPLRPKFSTGSTYSLPCTEADLGTRPPDTVSWGPWTVPSLQHSGPSQPDQAASLSDSGTAWIRKVHQKWQSRLRYTYVSNWIHWRCIVHTLRHEPIIPQKLPKILLRISQKCPP